MNQENPIDGDVIMGNTSEQQTANEEKQRSTSEMISQVENMNVENPISAMVLYSPAVNSSKYSKVLNSTLQVLQY